MASLVFGSLAGFALLHSVLASTGMKHIVRRRFGERAYFGLYRFLFNGVSTITFLPIVVVMALTSGPVIWRASGIISGLLIVVQILCGVGLVYAGSQIDFMRLLGVRQMCAYFRGDALPLPPEPFVQQGMYGLVRHPLYSCIIVSLWALPTMRAGTLAFAVGSTVYFIVGSYLEERRLIAEMGGPYTAYRERVPFLIPFVHWPAVGGTITADGEDAS